MTYKGGEFSAEQLFLELKNSVKEEKIQTQGEFNSLVDGLIDEKISYGFFSEDEDLEQLKKSLKSRWMEIEENIEKINRYIG